MDQVLLSNHNLRLKRPIAFKYSLFDRAFLSFLKLIWFGRRYARVSVSVCPPPELLKTIHVKGSLNNQPNKSYCLSVSLYGTCYRYC